MSLDVARRVALGAQGFTDTAPTGKVTRRHMHRAMGRMRVVQLDSIPVIARTQYLPFFSRLGCYDMGLFDQMAYEDDAWFEIWSHEASVVPVASEPLFRWTRERAKAGHTWKGLYEVSQREPAYVQSVLEEVRERGVVAPSELSDPRPKPKGASGWGSGSMGALALDWLWRIGEVGIRRRGNFEKVFSPIESIVPAKVLAQPTPTQDDALRELTMLAVQAHGVGTLTDISDYFRISSRLIRPALESLIEEGRVLPATVQSWAKPAFADPAAKTPRAIAGATVLSPFDPVVWNRDRAERIWGFEYRIEIYVPAAKRRWGYYVLPIMVDGHLVGRADLKNERDTGVLRVKASHSEEACDGPEMAAQMWHAIDDLRAFLGCERIEVEPVGNLASSFAMHC